MVPNTENIALNELSIRAGGDPSVLALISSTVCGSHSDSFVRKETAVAGVVGR